MKRFLVEFFNEKNKNIQVVEIDEEDEVFDELEEHL